MSLENRISILQLVMSSFAATAMVQSSEKLQSAANYNVWRTNTYQLLLGYSADLARHFQGEPPVVVSLSDDEVDQLNFWLERALNIVLHNTVSRAAMDLVLTKDEHGSALLDRIIDRFSKMTARSLYNETKKLSNLSSGKLMDSLQFLKDYQQNCFSRLEKDEFLGLLFLKLINNPDAERRVLEDTNPSLSLMSVYSKVQDLV